MRSCRIEQERESRRDDLKCSSARRNDRRMLFTFQFLNGLRRDVEMFEFALLFLGVR